MSAFLAWLTTFVCLLGLAASLCLGLYIITRTPRSRLSWLAALTLWSRGPGFASAIARCSSNCASTFDGRSPRNRRNRYSTQLPL